MTEQELIDLADRTFPERELDELADVQARALAEMMRKAEPNGADGLKKVETDGAEMLTKANIRGEPCPELDGLLDSFARRVAGRFLADMLEEADDPT